MVADQGYDDKELYEYIKKTLRIDLVCPQLDDMNIPKRGLSLYAFINWYYEQTIYNKRRTSIESLIEHIKSVFRINPLQVRGFHTVSAIVYYLSVLLYQIMVYYNCKNE